MKTEEEERGNREKERARGRKWIERERVKESSESIAVAL
jgi:hypothetical protein